MSEQIDPKSIFLIAVDKATPAERDAYLNQACAGDQQVRQRVETLLKAHDELGSFLEHPAVDAGSDTPTLPPSPTTEGPGTLIGPYKLLQQIGEGGMGVVYLAEQQEPVRRRVALKIIKPGMDSRQVIARFEAERQALAMMDHVSIARVLDAGTTNIGRPYFVMELVKGAPITTYCDSGRLTPRERLELFVPVCQALQHAHQKGIIHRDIKPSNVLVCLYDGKPVPKVIDFGVAKAIEQRLTEKTMFTQHGQIVGTMEYMSPEQAEMSQLDIDTRSDIYSLGVLLYELLTGSTPITKEQLRVKSFAELLIMICEQEPVRPSTRLSESGDTLPTISAQRRIEPKKLSLLLRGELDWIVMTALEKDRTRRYESAGAFAADVQRYLNDEAVQACPPSTAYRLRKMARRNRIALATAAAFAVLLIVGTCVSTWQAVRARRAENIAQTRMAEAIEARGEAEESRQEAVEASQREEQQREVAELARDSARQAAVAAEQARQKAAAAKEAEEHQRQQAEAALETSQRNLYFNQIALANRYWEGDNLERAEKILDECPPRFRHWEWRYLKQLCHAELISFPGDHATFSPDGKTLAIVQPAAVGVDRVLLWDMELRQDVAKIEPGAGGIYALDFASSDGSQLAFVCEDQPSRLPGMRDSTRRVVEHSVRLVDIESSDEILRLPAGKDWPLDLTMSPDKQHVSLATGVANPVQGGLMAGRLVLWNAQTGEIEWEKKHFGEEVAFHPQGTWLATVHGVRSRIPVPPSRPGSAFRFGLSRRNLVILNVADGQKAPDQVPESTSVFDIAYTPDGNHLAALASDGVAIFSTKDAKLLYLLERQTQGDKRGGILAFSADSSRLAVGDSSGAIRIWDLSSQEVIRTYRAHGGNVIALSFHPSGDYLVSGGSDGTVRVWDARNQQRWRQWSEKNVVSTAINLKRKQFATLSYRRLPLFRRKSIELRDTETSAVTNELVKFRPTAGAVRHVLTFSPDGTRLAGEIADNVVSVWDTVTGETVATLKGHTSRVGDMAFDPQAKLLASCTSREVRLWNLQNQQQIAHVHTTGEGRETLLVKTVTFSRDGQRLAVAGTGASTREHVQPGRVELWEAATAQLVRAWPLAHESTVADVSFSHDSRLLATAGWDEIVGVWDLATGKQIHKLSGHRSYVRGVTFSPDDKRIVSTGSTTKLWDTETGQEILSMDVSGLKPSFDPLAQNLGITSRGSRVLIVEAQKPQTDRSQMTEPVSNK